ncbi:MAG: hypothetical protein KJZ69_16585 [Phycisphaerales bacterium]|nr:hypothetical protein [Phycisphaerales bacterium]
MPRWTNNAHGVDALHAELTGMFVLAQASTAGVRLLTDRMGFRPVYHGPSTIGTRLEDVAALDGLSGAFDPVSLGELLVHNVITFPYTSRRGIVELPPASLVEVGASGAIQRTRTIWEPREPEGFGKAPGIEDELEDALRFAGLDITRGANRVGVTLSGGRDSRAVLGVIPKDRVAACLTYCTRENRETDVARRVAQAFGLRQVLVQRGAEFYAELLDSGISLLGTEVRANAHGLCLLEAGMADDYDLIVGGQLSDTLLKDHFMPVDDYERLRPKSLKERAKAAIRSMLGRGEARVEPTSCTRGRDALEAVLQDEVRREVASRRAKRLEDVAKVRPNSAREWQRFWPTSRQDDSAHSLGNSRIVPWDVLFMHSRVVDAACRIPPRRRCDGELSSLVFARLYGPAASIEDANTGLPMDATPGQVRATMAGRWRNKAAKEAFNRLDPSEAPWNDVQGSWVDSEKLQKHSPRWGMYRERLLGSVAIDVLRPVLKRDAKAMVAGYDETLPPTVNQMVMQLALVIDGVLSRRPSLAAS